MKKILTKGIQIYILKKDQGDFISLTDIARFKDKERTEYVIQNWMRNRDTIEFLGIWEHLNNPVLNTSNSMCLIIKQDQIVFRLHPSGG